MLWNSLLIMKYKMLSWTHAALLSTPLVSQTWKRSNRDKEGGKNWLRAQLAGQSEEEQAGQRLELVPVMLFYAFKLPHTPHPPPKMHKPLWIILLLLQEQCSDWMWFSFVCFSGWQGCCLASFFKLQLLLHQRTSSKGPHFLVKFFDKNSCG